MDDFAFFHHYLLALNGFYYIINRYYRDTYIEFVSSAVLYVHLRENDNHFCTFSDGSVPAVIFIVFLLFMHPLECF